ncbi:MAG: hypothetical protein GF307_05585 [candidate division Zixibacteria bacterium]|nr:hypothetical protein [candidate division Zixibacteria bacterium]
MLKSFSLNALPRAFILLTAVYLFHAVSIRASLPETMVFERVAEPKEKAFTILIPKGWQTDGGIIRINPMAGGGPANSIAAKLDFTVKKDRQGTVMVRWLPDMLYYDARYSPAGQMGMFPPGSYYQGMLVCPLMPAVEFLGQMAFPYVHPDISDVKVIERKPLPELARKYQQRVLAVMPQMTFTYDAAVMTVTYKENGVNFKEKFFTVVENWGALGAGMWGNKETFCMRAPAAEFEKYEPVVSIIQNSVKINQQWLTGEIKGQAQRGEIAINTQKEIQRIGREIASHRSKTMAEINNDMFLTLTEQEEYVNPYTNEIEIGSNQWDYRWVNESGDVIYSNKEDYNPNHDINLNRSDFKKTKIRKRFPQ